ncbi:hypothetical protein DO021_02150 [Desulfobacter hydrogenophilus]|uniref:DUF1566 domain-containing protein n=1 Tax=Desulfobacter hydrogenophilus TaxID=2291 RepID=A0A328FHB3_9BACT|nr:DUF1566 domain-containing protein [Desulfobacter hydrogenophilus]NDY70643.1 DUF1566 domain-containing protein [Desulfobacter hydrogenophilus]QBH14007.1 DUF1566 domain-containing protein [Desulfobacter hydrogenophilus]RAM03576.1 hypothetical protein DO021_02150 [Desulfobacter hydrogenophilus]
MKGPFQTGQNRCWNSTGDDTDCNDSGQDGESRSGAPWPEPRFNIGQDTVTDCAVGLVWLKNAGLSDFPLSWQEALDFVADLNRKKFVGRDGWRLPRRRELFLLVSHTRINPAIVHADLFENIFNGYYWTGNTCARLPDQAWYIHAGGGRVVRGMKHQSAMVWPVHDPDEKTNQEKTIETSIDPDQRFQTKNSIVFDRETELQWMRNADVTGRAVTWSQALEKIHQLNREQADGFRDWRLPNIRELESLVALSRHSPAICGTDCFDRVQDFYWSSTTSVYEPAYAWALYTRDGYIGVGHKADAIFFVWPVRG